jgi:hypothetical protein
MMLSVLFSEILLFEPQASLGFLDFLLLLFLCQDKKSKELRRKCRFFDKYQIKFLICSYLPNMNTLEEILSVGRKF